MCVLTQEEPTQEERGPKKAAPKKRPNAVREEVEESGEQLRNTRLRMHEPQEQHEQHESAGAMAQARVSKVVAQAVWWAGLRWAGLRWAGLG
jgi:hypothetical protein